ncbi:rhamnogalacturonan acetylesterase [Halosimplex aquaticum]|uniref:Rhamnogalacturonan acetylesterase n=1 Tax=Halosimplex aquaticum TaxID=3026162 RepID=A0ABD5XYV5_9EURY|nr:rhamnogalacturonan acetylesterase [Halosimplex aquaticum]
MSSESPTVHLIGDSTMAEKGASERPQTGWGTPFAEYVDESVTVKNHACNGRSTRTFRELGHWEPAVEALAENHYVFVQFGHNDESSKPRATTEVEFTAHLERYVEETRERGAEPVLLTPITRRQFDGEGEPKETHPYSPLVRDVARQRDVPLIDADERSRALLREMGPEASKSLFLHLSPDEHANYPDGVTDDTHFSRAGARRMAELVLDGLEALDHELAAHIVRD